MVTHGLGPAAQLDFLPFVGCPQFTAGMSAKHITHLIFL